MLGRECERRIRRRHMLSASSVVPIDSAAITPDSFNKDGRNVRVGDCALFKPPDSSPPFIGIIHSLFSNKEDSLSLCVNWLYRPADVKLGKGTSLEAAPNEVFYAFHKDEIPAASLLHPCKVAFLHKGVELPTGTSSFVCRRVYDTENNCLRWLTDQDYIKEHQEEVDKLLDRTRLEMHGALQPGALSPKPLNGPTGTHTKPGADSVQSSAPHLVSRVKGKKRDRSDQGSDPIKRERLSRADDADSGQFRPEQHLKFEISKITEKGGLVDFEGVEKFVQLMQPDSSEKKIDLACRIMLVGVIVFTDRFDCLGRFVQLRGLLILDEWLQEFHKGKIGDGKITKESDKSVVEFLLTSLRALDKLPVNLHALQSCNVGKSVNHLRSHKNSEIQKKARSLVDTWKKRVEAELNMNIIDSKSGPNSGVSWSSKMVVSEVTHVGNRRPGGSSEVVIKSNCAQSAAGEIHPVKLGSSDAVAKFMPASPRSAKPSAPDNTPEAGSSKDLNPMINVAVGPSDPPMSTIKQEKSSSSSQSQNNSQPCSSDHAKTGGSFREDARSSTAWSVGVDKISTGASRHRKPTNGVPGSAHSGVHKESFRGKFSSLNRNLTSEKDPPTGATYERASDVPSMDHGGSQRLTVEVPDSGRSPPRSTNDVFFENSVGKCWTNSSPPSHLEKLDHLGHEIQGKTDALHAGSADVYQCQEGCVGSEEGNISSAALTDEGKTAGEDWKKLTETSPVSGPSPGAITKMEKSCEASFSSMNALVESCVRLSKASAFATAGDDIGMNLLATVAAGELPSAYVSPGSPRENSTAPEDYSSGNDGKSGKFNGDIAKSKDQQNDGAERDAHLEQVNSFDALRVKEYPQLHPTPVLMNFSNEVKVTSSDCGEKTGEENGHGQGLSSDRKHGDVIPDTSVVLPSADATKQVNAKDEGATLFEDQRKSGDSKLRSNSISDSKIKVKRSLFHEDKTVDSADVATINNSVIIGDIVDTSAELGKGANGELSSCSLLETFRDTKDTVHKESDDAIVAEPHPAITTNIASELTGESGEDVALSSTLGTVLCMEPKTDKADEIIAGHKGNNEKLKVDLGRSNLDQNSACAFKSEKKEDLNHSPGGSDTCEENLGTSMRQVDWRTKLNGCKLIGSEAHGREEPASSVNASTSLAARLNIAVKLDFDLNEGCSDDDGGQAELAKSSVPGSSQLPISPILGSVPASITVASAAKGSFFPPENPIRSKGEVGWKGSAATSAFRPAEPRRVPEMPLGTTNVHFVSNSTRKQARHPLDIDLNMPDQRVFEDVASQNPEQVTTYLEAQPRDGSGGRLDFDLNRLDESPEIPQLPGRSPLSTGFYRSELNALRNFDLNNGPGLDEAGIDTVLHTKGNVPTLSALPGVRMNCGELNNLSSWFPSSNTYSAIPLPSILAGRGEQSYPFVPAASSQRILGHGTSGNYFGSEIYRGPVLSSSPAVALPPVSPFQYSGFPFEANFSLPSNLYSGSCSTAGVPLGFSAISPQLGGSTGAVTPSHYPRAYIMNLSSGASNIGPENRKWGGQALDLNAGPGGGTEAEQRDEQLKVYHQMAGGLFKRKEPDGGWDGDKIGYKEPPPWQ